MKRDVKNDILEAGARLIHGQGFNRTGLKEILEAAGVPKGSFYFYFKSKEEFGLALIEHFSQATSQARQALADQSLPPLARLARFFALARERFAAGGCGAGCPIGNLAQEMSDLSPAMRQALSRSLAAMAGSLAKVLAEAVELGEIQDVDPARTAAFILDAWEGALLRMKTEKSVEPLLRFEDVVFNRLLR